MFQSCVNFNESQPIYAYKVFEVRLKYLFEVSLKKQKIGGRSGDEDSYQKKPKTKNPKIQKQLYQNLKERESHWQLLYRTEIHAKRKHVFRNKLRAKR